LLNPKSYTQVVKEEIFLDSLRSPSTRADRREVRKRTFLGGRIVFNGGATALDCLVRDMSDSGCRLTIPNTVAVPSQFTLTIRQDGREFSARIKWRDAKSIRVEFWSEDDWLPKFLG